MKRIGNRDAGKYSRFTDNVFSAASPSAAISTEGESKIASRVNDAKPLIVYQRLAWLFFAQIGNKRTFGKLLQKYCRCGAAQTVGVYVLNNTRQ